MKGFYSTIIIIILLLILVSFSIFSAQTNNKITKMKNDLIILENASKERTIIENNVDRIIQIKLLEQVEKENYNLILIQTEINSSLLKYLKNKTVATNMFFENSSPLTLEYLMLNSTAYLLEIKGIKYAEYSYTSLPLMNSIVSAKLGNGTIIHFKIPIGYSTKVIR